MTGPDPVLPRLFAASVLLFGLLVSICAPARSAPSGADADVAAVLAHEQMFSQAIRGDTALLERLLSPDFVYNTAEGSVIDRDALRELLRAGAVRVEEVRLSAPRVRVRGDVAVVSGLATVRATRGGKEVSAASRYLHVWLRDGERWRLDARQVTYAPTGNGN